MIANFFPLLVSFAPAFPLFLPFIAFCVLRISFDAILSFVRC